MASVPRIRAALRRARPLLARLAGAERAALLAMLVVVAGVWGFVEIADEVTEGQVEVLDVRILRALREPGNPAALRGPAWLEEAARDVTALGSGTVLALVTGLTVGYLWLQRARAAAIVAVVAVIGAAAAYTALKAGFGRPRPTVVPALVEETSRSFPSGHSTMAAVVYLSLAVTFARRESRWAVRTYLIGAGAAITALVGLSRVALGVHYPSDVLGGWVLGLAWAAAWSLLLMWLQRAPR